MLTVTNWIIDMLFPPRSNELAVRGCRPSVLLQQSAEVVFKKHLYLLAYEKPLVRALITENKYHQNERAAKLLGETVQLWTTKHPSCVFIPVPLGSTRQKERGYNQVTEVLKQVSGSVILSDILTRTKETKPQTSLNRTDRLQNMVDVFSCVKPNLLNTLSGKTVVIVDDVITTGATLTAARAALAPHLPQNTTLLTLALAH